MIFNDLHWFRIYPKASLLIDSRGEFDFVAAMVFMKLQVRFIFWIQKLSAGNEVIKLTLAGFFSQHCPFFTQQYLREYRHFWLDFLVIVINTIIILIFIILTLLCRAWHIWEVPWQWRWRPLVGRSTRRSHQSSLRGPVDPPDVKKKVLLES